MWSNDYWPLAINAFLAPPEGPKTRYSRPVVDLAMRLHVRLADIVDRLNVIGQHTDRTVERLLNHYKAHPKLLKRDVARLCSMGGFGNSDAFYDGVETSGQEFEWWYRPMDETGLTPAMLTLFLNLYFRLVPSTMVEATPEVADMARRTGFAAGKVVEVLRLFLHIDPCARVSDNDGLADFSPLTPVCRDFWRRFDDGDPIRVAREADKFLQYYL